MTIELCQKEIVDHQKKIKTLQNNYDNEKDDHVNNLQKCSDAKKQLIRSNNTLTLENKTLKTEVESKKDIYLEHCNTKIEAEKMKLEKYKKEMLELTGGGFREKINNLENILSGGMIGEIKKTLKTNYTNEMNNLKNIFNNNQLNGGGNLKGGSTIVFIIVAVIKITLMTVGTFLFDWWPIMMIISFYCVFIEYKMTLLTGNEIMGTPIVFLLAAYFCPCCWTLGRLGVGWTTTKNTSPTLFNVLSKCTNDSITLNFDHFYGKPCKEPKCLWTTDECYNALFGK